MSNVIEQKRIEIDLIDADIIRLLNERYDACIAIGEAKKKGETAVFDPNREQKILERIESMAKYPGTAEAVWPAIMSFSRDLQSKL